MSDSNNEKTGKYRASDGRSVGRPFKPGQSGNPKGTPKLPPDVRLLKHEALMAAIIHLHKIMTDKEALERMSKKDFHMLAETIFDRFGLPKVTKEILVGDKDEPVCYSWGDSNDNKASILPTIPTDRNPSTTGNPPI